MLLSSNQYSAVLAALLVVYTDTLSLPWCLENEMINTAMNILAEMTQFNYDLHNSVDLNNKR